MDGISWANMMMLLATIPRYDIKSDTDEDEIIEIAPEDEEAEIRKQLGL